MTPIRSASHAEVETLVAGWREGAGGLRCVHSGNYVRTDGTVVFDEDGYSAYLREFFEPVGVAVVDAWREGDADPDYEEIVRGVLRGTGLSETGR